MTSSSPILLEISPRWDSQFNIWREHHHSDHVMRWCIIGVRETRAEAELFAQNYQSRGAR